MLVLTRTHFTQSLRERPLNPSSSRDVAISMRLDTRRRTTVATPTRLPRYVYNDRSNWLRVRMVAGNNADF